MTGPNLLEDLLAIASTDDFAFRSIDIVDRWKAAGVGVESVEVVLRFMEDHPSIDYGVPGHLVHFIERFYGPAYDDRVIESIRRRPTPHTAWLLNRLINGAKTPEERMRLIAVMEEARRNPLADARTVAEFDHFLDWQRKRG